LPGIKSLWFFRQRRGKKGFKDWHLFAVEAGDASQDAVDASDAELAHLGILENVLDFRVFADVSIESADRRDRSVGRRIFRHLENRDGLEDRPLVVNVVNGDLKSGFQKCFSSSLTLRKISQSVRPLQQGILKYHCTIDLLFDWFGLVSFANKNKNCQLSNS
jgi:hypothetical protein